MWTEREEAQASSMRRKGWQNAHGLSVCRARDPHRALQSDSLIHGDCLKKLRKFPRESVDLIATDPPYGYGFMGKDWDRVVPAVEIWRESLRVLKPGAFLFVMSAPRQDVLSRMIGRIEEAGFLVGYTSIYWTYSSGFPKAMNMGKMVDKRAGAKRKVIGKRMVPVGHAFAGTAYGPARGIKQFYDTLPATPEAKALNGSYAGFQPKPAVEVILVAMKPLSEKTFVDQAVRNRKGVTWLDDGRIPSIESAEAGRFPANLLVSGDVLNHGTDPRSASFSRYFDLDAWARKTFPFLIVPKPSASEKNHGSTENSTDNSDRYRGKFPDSKADKDVANKHPTIKPLRLMSYLITLGSREGDVVLDPFAGSGTTCVAAARLGRKYIGIELNRGYIQIAKRRLRHGARWSEGTHHIRGGKLRQGPRVRVRGG